MIAFIEAEVRRIAPIVQEAAMKYYKQYETEATKVAMQYYGQAEKLAKDYYGQARKYSAQAQKSAQVYAKKAGHGMLRGIHSSLVYLDQMDTGKMTKNMKAKMDAIMDAATAYFKSLSKYITIDRVNMEITISIPHGGLLKPSFSQTYKAVETAVVKSVDTLKATATETYEQMMTKISGLKSKVEELKGQAVELQKELMKKSVGRAKVWHPRARQTRKYPSMMVVRLFL